jgi:hypothetical protein
MVNVLSREKKATIVTLLRNGVSQREISRKVVSIHGRNLLIFIKKLHFMVDIIFYR